MEEATAQERVGQLLLVVGGDDDDRALAGGDALAGFVDVEAHPVRVLEEIVGEFDVGLVDLVDQQHGQLGRGERLPQFALADVVGDVVDACVAELAVAKPRDRVIFVEALMRLGGGLHVPLDQRRAGRLRDLVGEHGLAGAGLALDQQRAAQRHGGVDRHLEVVGRDIGVGAGEAHGGGPVLSIVAAMMRGGVAFCYPSRAAGRGMREMLRLCETFCDRIVDGWDRPR